VKAVLGTRRAVFLAAAAYVLAPGPREAFFSGIPLGLGPFVALIVGVFAWFFLRPAPEPVRAWTPVTAALLVLCAIKTAAAVVAPPVGWVGRYYPNGDFSGAYRRSTEFLALDATRIDRSIDFRDDRFPVYFLNEADFNRGIRREVTLPVSVTWDGYVAPSTAVALPLTITTKGTATLAIDDRPVAAIGSRERAISRSELVALTPGPHRIRVTYQKLADTDPLIRVQGLEEHGDSGLVVTPQSIGETRRRLARPATLAGRAADALAALAFAYALLRLVIGRRDRQPHWLHAQPARALAAAMLALFLAQGVIAAAPHVHRAVSLSGGDDWLAFEARAREVQTGGLLMRFGQPLGAGEVFYYYPGYSYFLAAVHRLTGEDLSGPIAANFLLLFLANVVVFRLAATLFGRSIALASMVGLVVVEELAFMRYYTPALLSENLYVLTVPLAVLALVRFHERGRLRWLLWAGVAAGASALTRPVMLLYLVPAAGFVFFVSIRAHRDPRRAFGSAAVLIGSCLAVVSLATIRNYLVAGSPVLICETPAHMFVQYNVPPAVDARPYMYAYGGGVGSAARVLARIILDHPLRWAAVALTKIGFSFGLLSLLGGRVHPELVAASVGYLAALVWLPAARASATWPVHGFVAAHLAGMVLSMPTIYGYRLILPMYLFLPMFGALVVAAAATRIRNRQGAEMAVAAAGRKAS